MYNKQTDSCHVVSRNRLSYIAGSIWLVGSVWLKLWMSSYQHKLSIVSYNVKSSQITRVVPFCIGSKLWSMVVRAFGCAKWNLFFLVVFVWGVHAQQIVSLATLHELTLIIALDLRDVRDAEFRLIIVLLEEEGLLHGGASVICDIVVALVWPGTICIKSARSLILIFILHQVVIRTEPRALHE